MSVTSSNGAPAEQALVCPECGDPCAKPAEHLATQRKSVDFLFSDDPCLIFAELNKWGLRMRVIKAYQSGEVRSFVEVLGDEDDYLVPPFIIQSYGDDPTEWNRVGECMEIAADRHDTNKNGVRRGRWDPGDGKRWAEELAERHDFERQWHRRRSVYGRHGFTQRGPI